MSSDHTHPTAPGNAPAPDLAELRVIAARIRADAWDIAERWSIATEQIAPAAQLRSTENGNRFGEVPAFLAALAHALEEDTAATPDPTHAFDARDKAIRRAATEHARQRADAGYDQRDMLIEFVALRRVIWEYLAEGETRPSIAAEHVIGTMLDAVIVEAVDQSFTELTEALIRRAERDPLTGLLNRQTFHDRLAREIARARRHGRQLTVVSVDLDAFKQVNDSLGHLAGDAVLKRVATLLSTHTRDEDLVGRLGGDEFAVVLVEADPAAARDLVRRLRIHLAPARRHFGLPREFGISYGAAEFGVDGNTVEELLFAADAGMYTAKGSGRGERMLEVGHLPTIEKVRVLVADDDHGVRALCTAVLEEAGFDVIAVRDGFAAIEAALTEDPDIALVDVSMPNLDGWNVLEQLAADGRTQHLPVVMLTGRASEADLDKAWKGGALDFIPKPFDPEALVAAVHRVLEYDASQDTPALAG